MDRIKVKKLALLGIYLGIEVHMETTLLNWVNS